MSNFDRATYSSPELSPVSSPVSSPTNLDGADPSLILQGLASNVKLLLKLIEDHKACTKDYDGRKTQRVASMISIIDEVKSRLQKSQTFGRRREAALRRCNTELRAHQNHNVTHRDQRKLPHETGTSSSTDEKEVLRKELNASLAARKSLERMFSSLGKEKEIMAAELARKAHELEGMEEHLNDLKAQNAMLSAKVQACAIEHQGGDDIRPKDDNVTLEEHLLKSLDGYKSIKRRLKEAKEENRGALEKMVEMDEQAKIGLKRIAFLRKRMNEEEPFDVEEELSSLEDVFRSLEEITLSKYKPNRCEDYSNSHNEN